MKQKSMRNDSARQNRFVIIMAGGKGERFWPMSRERTPKQLLAILSKRSFLQQAVDRVLPIVPLENILIITNAVQAGLVRRQLPGLPKENVVCEPMGRDTCAAVALGAALAGARSANAVMAVLPADHIIPDENKFQQVLGDSFDLASNEPLIVTIGIAPTEPSTGYGYIRSGNVFTASKRGKPHKTRFYKAEQFVEKPPYEKAVEFLKSGNYRWNAGMFIWSFATVSEGFQQHKPEMHAACQRWRQAASHGPSKLAKALAQDYPLITKVSIDYALMEHARNVVVAEGAFEWDDLGSWTALARHIRPDKDENCVLADLVSVNASRNVIYDARSKSRRTPIALVGITDSIVVQTDDATLVAHKNHAQKVKELVRKLGETPQYKKLA